MNFIKSKIFLNKDIDLYLSDSRHIYVSGPLGTISNKLNFRFEFEKNGSSRSLVNGNLKILFSSVKFGIYSVTLGYYILIDLIGLGYKIKKVTSLVYRFYLGQSHYVYFFVPSEILF